MILGNIKTFKSCGMGSLELDKFIEELKKVTPETPSGRIDLWDGAFMNISGDINQEPAEGKVFESHEKYIDIQYVFVGTEEMEYADTADLTVTQPYDADKDCALYTGKGTLIKFKTGDFAVYAPMDGHKPGCGNSVSRKVIIKVPVK